MIMLVNYKLIFKPKGPAFEIEKQVKIKTISALKFTICASGELCIYVTINTP